MVRSTLILICCWLLLGQGALANRIEKIAERRLVVLTDNDENSTYHIVGFADAATNFRDVFSKQWKHHTDIRYATLSEMPDILKETPGDRLAVVMLNLMLDKRPSMDHWENYHVIGIYPGEQFADMSKVNSLMLPFTCYVFPENRPLITEFILAVKFMNDKVACELKKTGCDTDDDIDLNQSQKKQRTVAVLHWCIGMEKDQIAASGFFGGRVEFMDTNGFWAIYNGPKAAEYSFLVMASVKYGKITTTYFVANMSDASIMAKVIPGGWHYISGSRRPEAKFLEKLGRVYRE